MIPSTATQVLVTLVLIVPGFVYHGVRIRISGRTPGDSDLSTRLMQAIVTSTIFGLIYVAIAAPRIVSTARAQEAALDDLRWLALAGFVAAFLIPAASAWLLPFITNREWWQRISQWFADKARRGDWSRIDPRPSGWDVAFQTIAPCFVRVLMRDGTWFAGWFGENSYASSWPDPQTLFVELSYHVDGNGTIGEPVKESAGAVVDCADAVLIELIEAPEER